MTRPWLEPLPEAAAQGTRLDVAAAIPVIETDRLTLRAPRLEDWTILEPIWTTDPRPLHRRAVQRRRRLAGLQPSDCRMAVQGHRCA